MNSQDIYRKQVADLILICPETGQDMFIMSNIKEKDGMSTFMVCCEDKTIFYDVSIKIEEQSKETALEAFDNLSTNYISNSPSDLATNPKYMKRFGQNDIPGDSR